MKKILTLLFAATMLAACSHAPIQTANYRVVPLPSNIELGQGKAFTLGASTPIVCVADSLMPEAELLQQYIAQLTGRQLSIETKTDARKGIVLAASLSDSNPEAYSIAVDADRILIDGASSAGTFYGIQTLRKSIPEQLLPSDVEFPVAAIYDAPRFAYRGAHLDVARHPMEADSVKAFIDMLAMHNINRFHWHLSDDQGWRIEIKSYPKLAEVGGYRSGTMIERNWGCYDSIPVSGYYTQDQARDIVDYAKARHITVIPEIDLPGHMIAALKAYPELGCTGGPYEVWQRWGVSDDLLCAGNDSIYVFLDAVLSEIADIFPSEYIHLGGDECPKERWEECHKCQARIRQLGLKSDSHSSAEAKLQTYVMNRVQETLQRKGRKMIGWDEVLEGGAPDGAVIMSWRGIQGARNAAKQGHDAILTPTDYCYFDYCQSDDPSTEPVCIGGYLPLEKVYSFEPIPDGLTVDESRHILGAQANLWREYIKTLSHTQYMELPRLAAMCEVQWMQPGRKDYADFLERLPQLTRLYKANGYRYRE